MKKLALLILCCLLALSMAGCGSTPAASSHSSASTSQASTSATSEAPPEEEAPALPQPYELDQEDRMKTFSYDIPSTFEKSTDTNVNYYYPPNTENTMLQVLYSVSAPIDYTDPDTAAEVLEAMMDGIESSASVSDLTAEYGLTVAGQPAARFSCSMYVGTTKNPTLGVLVLDTNGILSVMASAPQEDDQLMASFDAIVDSIRPYVPENDFLSDETVRTTVNDSLYSYDFDQIASLAQSYIDQQNPAETDTAFAILDYAQQGQQILPNCTIVTDDFEDESTAYGTVQDISSSVSFVPYIENSITSTSIHVKVGFVKEDWLFMESMKIKVGEDDYISKYFDYLDVDRDTLGGSTIQEEMDCTIPLEDVEKLLAAADPVMRFEGQDGDTYDHQMTAEELSSLQTIYDLSNRLDDIRNVLNQWMDENMR